MIGEQIREAKQWIENADAVLITAGAGIGVDVVPFIAIKMDNTKTPCLLAS